MNAFIVLAVFLNLYCFSTAKEIPEYLHICKRNDPNVQSCFRKSVLALKPYVAKGIPELNIPTLEPMYIPDLLVAEPTGPRRGVKVTANSIKVYGCSDFDVKNLNIDFDAGNIRFDIKLNHLYIDGVYGIDGRILVFPVSGSGKVIGNFTNCVGKTKMSSELVERDGETFINVKSMDLKIQVGSGSIKLYNLFGGEGILGDVINDVINQNFDAFSKELFPALERTLSAMLLNMTNSIVSQFTFSQLFPTS